MNERAGQSRQDKGKVPQEKKKNRNLQSQQIKRPRSIINHHILPPILHRLQNHRQTQTISRLKNDGSTVDDTKQHGAEREPVLSVENSSSDPEAEGDDEKHGCGEDEGCDGDCLPLGLLV